MAPPTVLVTGGAGYIGSHTVLEMLNAGYNVICVDNLCNAYSGGASKLPEALNRVQEITGKKVNFYRVDITDREQVRSVFQEVSIEKTRLKWHVSKSFNGYSIFGTQLFHLVALSQLLVLSAYCLLNCRVLPTPSRRWPRYPTHFALSA